MHVQAAGKERQGLRIRIEAAFLYELLGFVARSDVQLPREFAVYGVFDRHVDACAAVVDYGKKLVREPAVVMSADYSSDERELFAFPFRQVASGRRPDVVSLGAQDRDVSDDDLTADRKFRGQR